MISSYTLQFVFLLSCYVYFIQGITSIVNPTALTFLIKTVNSPQDEDMTTELAGQERRGEGDVGVDLDAGVEPVRNIHVICIH
jgi:hypothetical protein